MRGGFGVGREEEEGGCGGGMVVVAVGEGATERTDGPDGAAHIGAFVFESKEKDGCEERGSRDKFRVQVKRRQSNGSMQFIAPIGLLKKKVETTDCL